MLQEKFKNICSFDERKKEALKKRNQYPSLIPLIIEPHKKT